MKTIDELLEEFEKEHQTIATEFIILGLNGEIRRVILANEKIKLKYIG